MSFAMSANAGLGSGPTLGPEPGFAPRADRPFACLGGLGARLFAGPSIEAGAERYASHCERLGELGVDDRSGPELRSEVAASGLVGRGGGEFALANKLAAAAGATGRALVVVNASEGEPASRKDRTLLVHRPHLVLDGAMAAAAAVGAREVVIYLHGTEGLSGGALRRALDDRPHDLAAVRLVEAPPRYVAGETSAVVSFLEGSGSLPRRRAAPAASSGVHGRPTVVANVETIGHLALVARFGAAWFRQLGDPNAPGSTLVTLAGEVEYPGRVLEVLGAPTFGDLLDQDGACSGRVGAVLVGGYAGTWIDAAAAFDLRVSRALLRHSGAPLGCGLVGVLGASSCGIATTARLVRWLAAESAGQCGLCAFGLQAVAELLSALAIGNALARDVRKLRRTVGLVTGQGACGHPTGVAMVVESALDTFASEVAAHLRGRSCRPTIDGFPLREQGAWS